VTAERLGLWLLTTNSELFIHVLALHRRVTDSDSEARGKREERIVSERGSVRARARTRVRQTDTSSKREKRRARGGEQESEEGGESKQRYR